MTRSFNIGRHVVGLAQPTYFVADIAANHDGDLARARLLVQLAAEAGANAVKFQHFKAETIVSDRGFSDLGAQVSHQATWQKGVVDVYRDASVPMDWTQELVRTCDEHEIDFFTAPYDLDLIDELAPFVCAWKCGSGDITWIESIERMASSGKPLLLATGASDMAEVRRAVESATAHTDQLVIMQCNTNYTGSTDNFLFIELNVLKTFAAEFPGHVLGLSDHTPGHATTLGAVALGARVIEKHFTDDATRDGPDHGFSMEPAEWQDMVLRTRELEAALGCGEKVVMPNEQDTIVVQRRAIRATHALQSGATVAAADVTVLRPCPPGALEPYRLPEVIGKRLVRDIDAGDAIRPADLE